MTHECRPADPRVLDGERVGEAAQARSYPFPSSAPEGIPRNRFIMRHWNREGTIPNSSSREEKMENHWTMEISRPVKNLYRFFGLMNFLLGVLQVVVLILILIVLSGIVQDFSKVFHILPGAEKIRIADLFQRSDIPFSTFILLSIPLVLIYVILPLCFLGMSLLLFLQGFLMFAVARVTRMEMSPEGVSLFSPGVSVQSSWKNIQGVIPKTYFFGLRHYEAVSLIEPARQTCAWWIPLWSRYAAREIPLSLFVDWRGRELGKAAEQYAPRILKNGQG